MLQPGEERQVRFTVDEDKLKFFNAQLRRVAEPGRFNVQIGFDSQSVREQGFELLQ
jgi:beta-glucosidase